MLLPFGELDIDEDTAALLAYCLRPPSIAGWHPNAINTLPGDAPAPSTARLLKSQIPVPTWADWDDALPGFVEIELVSHDSGRAVGEHTWTFTVTDIVTGWTENRSVPSKALE